MASQTGLHSNLGQRLTAAKQYIGDDEVFLANYSDGLSNVPLDAMIDDAAAVGVAVSKPGKGAGGAGQERRAES